MSKDVKLNAAMNVANRSLETAHVAISNLCLDLDLEKDNDSELYKECDALMLKIRDSAKKLNKNVWERQS